jgi:hypothetical protein
VSPVTATYDGRCPACGEPIKADFDEIVYSQADETWIHEDCGEEE